MILDWNTSTDLNNNKEELQSFNAYITVRINAKITIWLNAEYNLAFR
jgi:hypothetical protein